MSNAGNFHALPSMTDGWMVRVFNDPQGFGYCFQAVNRDRKLAMGPVVLSTVEKKVGDIVPTMATVDQETAQAIMDALWLAGVRPHDYDGAGELGAVKKHLNDMRAIAFDKIGITAQTAKAFKMCSECACGRAKIEVNEQP